MQNSTFKIAMQNSKLLKTFSFLFFIFAFCLFTFPTYAHVLKTSGSIGAVMHVTPDDDPIAGKESSFFFDFKDKNNIFTPQNCDCIITIFQSGKEIYTQPLFQQNSDPSLSNASLSFTFPQRDIYTIKISGQSLTPNTFKPFVLSYDIRIERSANAKDTSPTKNAKYLTWIPLLLVGICIISIFLLLYRSILQRK